MGLLKYIVEVKGRAGFKLLVLPCFNSFYLQVTVRIMLPWCSVLSLHNKNHVHIQSCCPQGGENPVFQEKCKILLNIFSAQPHLCFADVLPTFLLFTPRHHSSQRPFTFPLRHCFGDSSGSKVPVSRGMSCPHLGPPHTHPSSTQCPSSSI